LDFTAALNFISSALLAAIDRGGWIKMRSATSLFKNRPRSSEIFVRSAAARHGRVVVAQIQSPWRSIML
jgi:uncharacterized protein YneF (UPF0154 family)